MFSDHVPSRHDSKTSQVNSFQACDNIQAFLRNGFGNSKFLRLSSLNCIRMVAMSLPVADPLNRKQIPSIRLMMKRHFVSQQHSLNSEPENAKFQMPLAFAWELKSLRRHQKKRFAAV